MSALSQKETRALVRHLREQGADVKRTKKGIMVLFPNGASTTIHYTNSDHRSTMNQRAEILRAGLTWPFDHQRRENEETIMATPGISPEKRATLDRAIAEAGHGPTGIAAIRKLTGLSDPTVKLAMKAAGFEQKDRTTWVRPNLPEGWTEPEHPTLAELAEQEAASLSDADRERAAAEKAAANEARKTATLTAKEEAAKKEAARIAKNEKQNAARAAKVAAARGQLVLPKVVEGKDPGYPETYREIELAKAAAEKRAALEAQRLLDEADAAAEEAEAKAQNNADLEFAMESRENRVADEPIHAEIERARAAKAGEREFIDTMDSWTIPVPNKLQEMAKSMGLEIEVRVWHQP